ncbi:bifunctional metallophosphatase/5'-nucleotidase [Variovorax sp. LjRoot175]|uniref:5'-nucleotidase C-terminal domain-containing protein n=1 Tax=Variovorax sp. LjRoot175 TaxID=3342276 RepID=UPI003ECC2B40
MASASTSKLRSLVRHLDEVAASGDLAAVLVHLNDTYLIEARPPEVPGMARIARLLKFLRHFCRQRTGEDVVLALHAGDMLSPSYLSNTVGLKGRQMVEALNACGLDLATLGNHEFDFAEPALLERLAEAKFGFVMTNLVAPQRYRIPQVVRWPPHSPFIAILGIGGEDVRKKAAKCGFESRETEAALKQAIAEIAADTRIGALVVLTHMERNEDHALVDMVRRHWPRSLCAYVLGGHDHDMNWIEPRGSTVFLKNLANGRSISVVPIRKSALVTVGAVGFVQYKSADHERERALEAASERFLDIEKLLEARKAGTDIQRMIDDARQRELEVDLERAAQWPSVDAIRRSAIRSWMRAAPAAARRDHKRAFLRHVVAAISSHVELKLKRMAYDGLANEALILDAHNEAVDDWRRVWVMGAADGIQSLRQDSATKKVISKWLERAAADGRIASRERIIFDSSRNPNRAPMDARETSLRSSSTNFGNFVCDAVLDATGADLALVHAGSFRADDLFGAHLTVGNLIDTFLYDCPGALVELQLQRRDVDKLCAHATRKVGSGAFLQTSDLSALTDGAESTCRVVMSRYLFDRESGDGYLELLAGLHGFDLASAQATLNSPALINTTLIDLVIQGAPNVGYSQAQRIQIQVAEIGGFERQSAPLVEALRRYWSQAQRECVAIADALVHLEGETGFTKELDMLRLDVWLTIHDLMKQQGTLRLDPQLLDHLARSRERFAEGVDYNRLAERAWGFVYDWLVRDFYHASEKSKEK